MHSKPLRAASRLGTGPCKQHSKCSHSYSPHRCSSAERMSNLQPPRTDRQQTMHSRFLRAASYHGIGPCKQHMHCSHSYSSHTYSSGITEYLSDLQPPKTAKQTTMHSRSLRAASCFETGPCKQHKQCSLSYSSHNYLSRYSCAHVRSAATQDIRTRSYAFHVPVSSILSWDKSLQAAEALFSQLFISSYPSGHS